MAAINNRISKAKQPSNLLDAFYGGVNTNVLNDVTAAVESVQAEVKQESAVNTSKQPNNAAAQVPEIESAQKVIKSAEELNAEKEALKQVAGTEAKIHEELAARQRGVDIVDVEKTVPATAPGNDDTTENEVTESDIQSLMSKLTPKELQALLLVQQASADSNTFISVSDALARELNRRVDEDANKAVQPFITTHGVSNQELSYHAVKQGVAKDVLGAITKLESVKNMTPDALNQLTGSLTKTLMMYDTQSVSFMEQCVPTSAFACRDCGFRQHCTKSLTAYKRKRTSLYIAEDVALAVQKMFQEDPNYSNMTLTGLVNTLLHKVVEKYIPAARAEIDAKYRAKRIAEQQSAKKLANIYKDLAYIKVAEDEEE